MQPVPKKGLYLRWHFEEALHERGGPCLLQCKTPGSMGRQQLEGGQVGSVGGSHCRHSAREAAEAAAPVSVIKSIQRTFYCSLHSIKALLIIPKLLCQSPSSKASTACSVASWERKHALRLCWSVCCHADAGQALEAPRLTGCQSYTC